MSLHDCPPVPSSSVQPILRIQKLALVLLTVSLFAAAPLAAQSVRAIPASAQELFTVPGSPSEASHSPSFRIHLDLRPDGDSSNSSSLGSTPPQNSQHSWRTERFHWKPGLLQGLFFLGIQHGIRMQQGKTRRELDGPFWKDYADSVRGLEWKWGDGGKFFTNYVAHAAQGSVTGFIWIHNDPKSKYLQIGRNRAYWIGRMKAMAWTAVWSTQFEIGLISEASLGNVGQKPGTQAVGDFVTTPVLGTALLLEEDLVDRYIVGWVERSTTSHVWRSAARGFFNPCRSVANLLRFRAPWYRDARTIDNVSTIPN